MAVSSKEIEPLWKRYSDEGSKKGISVAEFFESNGIPYHTFEKWYKRKVALLCCPAVKSLDAGMVLNKHNVLHDTKLCV